MSSANIACGGHAGDEATMRATLRLCRAHGVAAGAHAAPAVDLNQVVVTASRTAQTQDATLAAVTVIDR
ncbi:hypothetical protein HKX41_12795, partial [Salinisphaera sp. USBA-960]|nr:hypothetical protein [Salifodinibacter halophilus]